MVNTTSSAIHSDRDRDPLLSGLLSNHTSSSDNNNNNHNYTDNTLGRLIRMEGGTNGGGRTMTDRGLIFVSILLLSCPGNPPPSGGGVTATAATAPLHSILGKGGVSSTSTGDYLFGDPHTSKHARFGQYQIKELRIEASLRRVPKHR